MQENVKPRIAVWHWSKGEPVPEAKVVVCEPGYAITAIMNECLRDDAAFGRLYVVPYEWQREMEVGSQVIPALHVRTQSDLARLPDLLAVKAERRALVCSPEEAIDFGAVFACPQCHGYGVIDSHNNPCVHCDSREPVVDVVLIVGFDKPMHPSWVRGIVEQCRATGVPCVLVTWGEYLPHFADNPTEIGGYTRRVQSWLLDGGSGPRPKHKGREGLWWMDGTITDWGAMGADNEYVSTWTGWNDSQVFYRVGSKNSGALLDGAKVEDWPGWMGGANGTS